jgi:hypothetical protein
LFGEGHLLDVPEGKVDDLVVWGQQLVEEVDEQVFVFLGAKKSLEAKIGEGVNVNGFFFGIVDYLFCFSHFLILLFVF